MLSQQQIERLLAPNSVGSTDDWRCVKEYLAASFAAYLGQEFEAVWEPHYGDIRSDYGFSFGIRSRVALGGPLAFEWYAVISHWCGYTDANVLLFTQDQRTIHFNGTDFLYFELKLSTDGERRWESRGWGSGECGEWEGYQRLTELG